MSTWLGNLSLSEFEKWWPGVKSHQITVKTVKTDRSQIKSSKSTDQVQDFKDPDQMTQIWVWNDIKSGTENLFLE